MNIFDLFWKSYKEARTRLEIPVMPVDSSGVEKFTASNPGDIVIDSSAPIVLAKGVTDADGAPNLFVDGTKNFETGAFAGKTAKLTIDDVDYYRTILSNTGPGIGINSIQDAVAASLVHGDIGGPQLTIVAVPAGADGNDYTLSIVAAPGTNDNLSASVIEGVLTVFLGKTDDALDNAKNTGVLVAAAIDTLPEFTCSMTGSGGVVVVTEAPAAFTGGIDAITIPSGTEYEILDYGLVNKFVPTDTDGDEKFTAGNPAVMQLSASTALAGKFIPVDTDGDEKFTSGNPASVQLSGSYLVQDAVIAQNETDSTEVDIQKWKYISILMPAGWDAATLTIKGSAVAGGTKRTIKNDVGQTFPAMTVAVDTIYTIDANALMLAGVHFITFVASAAQTTAARTIKVMCKA